MDGSGSDSGCHLTRRMFAITQHTTIQGYPVPTTIAAAHHPHGGARGGRRRGEGGGERWRWGRGRGGRPGHRRADAVLPYSGTCFPLPPNPVPVAGARAQSEGETEGVAVGVRSWWAREGADAPPLHPLHPPGGEALRGAIKHKINPGPPPMGPMGRGCQAFSTISSGAGWGHADPSRCGFQSQGRKGTNWHAGASGVIIL